jgi:hypothetical protein
LSRPNTKLTGKSISKRMHSASVKFKAVGRASGFQCALVKKRTGRKLPKPRFSRCGSPKAYKHLRHASYKFYVRALNAAGHDLTPAMASFSI